MDKGYPPYGNAMIRWKECVLPHALIAVVAILCLSQLWLFDTWPLNHDSTMFFLRTKIYADHMAAGDLLPVWSSVDNGGMGSPMPTLYHKLYYFVSAIMYLMMGDIQVATILSIALFMAIGGWGMLALVRHLTGSRYLGVCAALILLFANYTTTNWLVRGAMAELAGAMLVPWVILAFLRVVDQKREPGGGPRLGLGIGLGTGLALVFYSHSVLAFFLGIILAFTSVVVVVSQQARMTPALVKRVGKNLLVFLLAISPVLLLMATLGSDYDMERILTGRYRPEFHFKSLSAHFTGANKFFGRKNQGVTVQIDQAVFLLLVYGVVAVLLRARKNGWQQVKESIVGTGLVALSVIVFACTFLLSPWSLPFYKLVPGAEFIQFPWRLLAILTPAGIALAAVVLTGLPTKTRRRAMTACLVVTAGISGVFKPIQYGQEAYDDSAYPTDLSFSFFGEYQPVAQEPVAEGAELVGESCELTKIGEQTREDALETRYRFSCSQAEAVTLPHYASRYHEVVLLSGAGDALGEQGCGITQDFRCGVQLPECEDCILVVRYPTLGTVVSWSLW